MTPSLHLAGFAATIPWQRNSEFKRILSSYSAWSPVLVLTRDGAGRGSKGGRVSLDSRGQPRFDYRPSKPDATAMAKGAKAAVDALAAAGAVEIGSFLHAPFAVLPTEDTAGASAAATSSSSPTSPPNNNNDERKLAVEAYKSLIDPKIIRSRGGRGATIISAHQMGTARAGPCPKTGAVEGRTGESWEVENLFVADASLFPTASGVNPMISVCALSWLVAGGVAERAVGKKRAAAGARAVLARSSAGSSSSSSSSSNPSSSSLSPAAILREAVEGGSRMLPLSSSAASGNNSSSRVPVLVSRE